LLFLVWLVLIGCMTLGLSFFCLRISNDKQIKPLPSLDNCVLKLKSEEELM